MEHILPFDILEKTYKIQQQLGRGASGICYHLLNNITNKHYVLKKIPLHLYQKPKQLQSELKLLSTINHPNIIKLNEIYKNKDFVGLVFEYNYEKDLQKVLKQRLKCNVPLSQNVVWKIFFQVINALSYLHKEKIIHRDIKPSNIFINLQSKEIKIGDLGSAKYALGQNYTRIGTPLYLPPEIIKYQSYSQKADIWSLGITLYQLCTLKTPFNHNNFIKLSQLISYSQPDYPTQMSSKMKQAIKQMLKKEEKDRPTAEQLLQRYFPNGYLDQKANEIEEKQSQIQKQQFCNLQQPEDQVYAFLQQKNSQLQIKLNKKISVHQSILEQPSKLQQAKFCCENSSKTITIKKEDQVREQTITISQLQDSDNTIVLKVNPNDYNNFCGYYRDSRKVSRIHFDLIQNNKDSKLRIGKKSSLFKIDNSCEQKANQKVGRFFTKDQNGKENTKMIQTKNAWTHKRVNSRLKHQELMFKLKPAQRNYIDSQVKTNYQKQPQLIVIDHSPLIIPDFDDDLDGFDDL